jgi:hypothetical protein
MQAVLSLDDLGNVLVYQYKRIIVKRKVRATQSISLPNGKRFRNECLNYGKCRRKYTADGLGTGKVEIVR